MWRKPKNIYLHNESPPFSFPVKSKYIPSLFFLLRKPNMFLFFLFCYSASLFLLSLSKYFLHFLSSVIFLLQILSLSINFPSPLSPRRTENFPSPNISLLCLLQIFPFSKCLLSPNISLLLLFLWGQNIFLFLWRPNIFKLQAFSSFSFSKYVRMISKLSKRLCVYNLESDCELEAASFLTVWQRDNGLD